MNVRRFVGIDVASSSGWAVLRKSPEGEVVEDVGVWSFPNDEPPHRAIDKVAAWLLRQSLPRPPVVGVEDVLFARYTKAHATYWRVRTLIEAALSKVGLWPPVYVSPQEVKQMATGRGNATKEEMCEAARREFGVDLYARTEFDPENRTKVARRGHEDMADAIYVAVAVARKWTPGSALVK